MGAYTASDYAGMNAGIYSFYYGYEFEWCPEHGFTDHTPHQECEVEGAEWAFQAKKHDKTIAQYKASELSDNRQDWCETGDMLLNGFCKLFEDKSRTQTK